MSRALRIEYEGAWYHVINEGINEICVFPSDKLVSEFYSILSDITRYFSVEIHAYTLEQKGYQLLLHTPLGNISSAMQYLNGVFTQRFNKLHNRKGCLFSGRYKSIVINADMYLLQVSRYIHWLPGLNGCYQDIKDYDWSSCAVYLGNNKAPQWLYCYEISGRFSLGNMNYQGYLEQGVDKPTLDFYQSQSSGSVLGSKSFKQHLINRIEASESGERKSVSSVIKTRPTIEQIIDALEEKTAAYSVSKTAKHSNSKRNIAMTLCRDVGRYGLKEIATVFGVGHPRSISVIVSRTRKLIESDDVIKSMYSKTKEELEDNYC